MSSCFLLLFAFLKVTIMTFGGGYAAMPIVEKEIVEGLGLLSYEDYTQLLALDELTPGPVIINCATFIGMKVAGVPGAIFASLGCVLPPMIISLILISVLKKHQENPFISNALYVLKCMAAALIFSSMFKMVLSLFPVAEGGSLSPDVLSIILAVSSFLIFRKLKPSPIIVMLSCGLITLAVNTLF